MKNKTEAPVRRLEEQLSRISPGSNIVEFVKLFPYDNSTIGDMATVVQSEDENVIYIFPGDSQHVHEIAKALYATMLNAYALNPTTVCVPIPPASKEQKAEMSKHIRKLGEEAKVAVRMIRQKARKSGSDEETVEKQTEQACKKIDSMVQSKLMTI